MKKDTICPFAWNHLATKPSGHIRLCSISKTPDSLFYTDKGTQVFANNSRVEDIRNVKLLKKLRLDMLQGKWNPICERCKVNESMGLSSRRLSYRKRMRDSFCAEKAKQLTLSDGSINPNDFPIETLDLRFGNKCNLKCRMCDPVYSSKWFSDYQKVFDQDYFLDNGEKIYFSEAVKTKEEWYESEHFWHELLKNKDTINHIYLIGGEPFLIAKHFVFLNKLINLGLAGKIEIEYNTNLTLLTEDIVNTLKAFRKVIIGVSIESTFEENDYIRHPSKFSTILENLKKLDSYSSPNFRIWITTAIQVLNIYSIPKLIDWALEQKFNFLENFPKSSVLNSHLVTLPKHHCIQALPLAAKEKAKARLENCAISLDERSYEMNRPGYRLMADKLRAAVKFMYLVDQSSEINEFLRINDSLDIIRRETFSKTFPELAYDLRQSCSELSV